MGLFLLGNVFQNTAAQVQANAFIKIGIEHVAYGQDN